jgi:hypothetical protein
LRFAVTSIFHLPLPRSVTVALLVVTESSGGFDCAGTIVNCAETDWVGSATLVAFTLTLEGEGSTVGAK